MQILDRLDRIDERQSHQEALLSALQHNTEVARAERESIIMALSRASGQISETSRVCDDILRKIEILSSAQEVIKENLRDQALDITLLKKIISL